MLTYSVHVFGVDMRHVGTCYPDQYKYVGTDVGTYRYLGR